MCLCGVTGCSDQGDQMLRSVHPPLCSLSCDQTLASVMLELTKHVRSQKLPSRSLLMLTGRWNSASGHFAAHRPVNTDRTCSIRILPLWNLIGVDWTLAPSVRSHFTQHPVATRWLHLDQMNSKSGHTGTSIRSIFDPPFTSNSQSYVNQVHSNLS